MMAGGRLRRVVANLLSGGLHSGATLALGVMTTPVLIRLLGEERFGAARVLLDWLGYLALLELGAVEAARPFLGAAVARRDNAGLTRALATVMRQLAGAAILKVVAWLALCLAITVIVPVRPALAGDLRQAAFVGLLTIVVSPLVPFQILAEAEQRGYRVNLLLVVQAVLTTGLALALAWRSWGITGQFTALVIGGLPLYLVLGASGLRRFPGTIRAALDRTATREAPEAFGKIRSAALVLNLCSRVSTLTDNILIATLAAPHLVTPFFVTQRLALVAQMQLQGLGNATWAGLSDVRAREGEAAFHRRVIELTRMVAVAGAGMLAPIAAYNKAFVHCWVGPSAYGGDVLTALTAVNALLLAMTSVWGWCFAASGSYARLVRLFIAGAVVNLVASALATRLLGLAGPALGTTIMLAVTFPWWTLLMRDALGVPLRSLGAALLRPASLGAGFAVSLWLFARAFPPGGWVTLALSTSASVVVYALLCGAFVLDAAERRAWSTRVRGLLPSGRGRD